ncbi:MAG: FAD-dependent monooxygenase, partial [Rickettsiales bacterium]
MRLAGCGDRMDREGEVHDGFFIAHDDRMDRIDLFKHSGGRSVVVYGQTEITKDLYEARDRLGGKIIHNAENVQPHEIASNAPFVTYDIHGERRQVDCDYVVGADGFHGVSRSCIPKTSLKEHERTYPFGWLGILSATPPVKSELVYVKHDRGFALCSMRSKSVSRYYLQVPITDRVEDWSDEAFWA